MTSLLMSERRFPKDLIRSQGGITRNLIQKQEEITRNFIKEIVRELSGQHQTMVEILKRMDAKLDILTERSS